MRHAVRIAFPPLCCTYIWLFIIIIIVITNHDIISIYFSRLAEFFFFYEPYEMNFHHYTFRLVGIPM